jgi:hypothetical protein
MTADEEQMMRVIESFTQTNAALRAKIAELESKLEKDAKWGSFEGVLQILRMNAHEPGAAKNYVQMQMHWDEAIAPELPFRHMAVLLFRDGAKSPAELVQGAIESRDKAINAASEILYFAARGELGATSASHYRERIEALKKIPDTNPLRDL